MAALTACADGTAAHEIADPSAETGEDKTLPQLSARLFGSWVGIRVILVEQPYKFLLFCGGHDQGEMAVRRSAEIAVLGPMVAQEFHFLVRVCTVFAKLVQRAICA